MRHKFTKTWIEGLSVSARTRYTDTNHPTLNLRVTPAGTKTFYYRARHKHQGVIERKIGTFPQWTLEQARSKATELAASFNAGIDPDAVAREAKARQQRDSLTLNEAIESWLQHFAKQVQDGERRPKTLKNYTDIHNLHVRKTLGKKTLIEITPEVFGAFMQQGNHGATNHNLIRVIVSSAYKYASEATGTEYTNPTSRTRLRPTGKRDRYLRQHEVTQLFQALDEEPPIYQDLVRTILYTGQRKGAVYAMEWAELDLQRGLWTIPARKMKGKKAHTVPLIDEVTQILTRRQADSSSPYVFPWRDGKHIPAGHYHYWRRITKRAGLYADDPKDRLTIHDLRRTLASWQALEGVGIQQISQTLAHQDISLTASVYAHINAESTRAGIQAAVTAISKAASAAEQGKQEVGPLGPLGPDGIDALLAAMTEDEKAVLLARLKGERESGSS